MLIAIVSFGLMCGMDRGEGESESEAGGGGTISYMNIAIEQLSV